MVSNERKEGTVNQGGVKIRYTIAVSFFFSPLGPTPLVLTTLSLKSNSADCPKSRGKTIDKQRLFLIITIDMPSFRALLFFLSHYCACHIQAMQLRLVN